MATILKKPDKLNSIIMFKIKNMFQNLIKNFYCDYVVLFKPPISFFSRILFVYYKYFYIFYYFLNKRNPKVISVFSKNYKTHESLGLLGLSIMIKDYYKYYKQDLTSKKPVIFDVGANIGNFSIASKLFYPDSSIHAFEPVPNTYDFFKYNLKEYHSVIGNFVALGNKKETINIYASEEHSDRSSFYKENLKESKDVIGIPVNIITLDNYVKDNNIKKIDLMKIDVEGFEYQVVGGAGMSLSITDFLLIEVHLKDGGDSLGDIIKFICSKGFDLIKFGKIWFNNDGSMYCFEVVFKNKH